MGGRSGVVTPISPVRIGNTDILYAQGIRAGSWLFFTGHEATDFRSGIDRAVIGKPGLPLAAVSRYRREGDFLYKRINDLIVAEGGDLHHIVRADQYYPRVECVNPFEFVHRSILRAARKVPAIS
jgi:hypothetical protein